MTYSYNNGPTLTVFDTTCEEIMVRVLKGLSHMQSQASFPDRNGLFASVQEQLSSSRSAPYPTTCSVSFEAHHGFDIL